MGWSEEPKSEIVFDPARVKRLARRNTFINAIFKRRTLGRVLTPDDEEEILYVIFVHFVKSDPDLVREYRRYDL